MVHSILKSGSPASPEQIEREVERLVAAPTLSELVEFLETPSGPGLVYASKVVELRVLRGVTKRSLAPEIEYATHLLRCSKGYHACGVYALLGLLCWPNEMPGFMSEVAGLLGERTGYQILLLFAEKVNYSSEIDEKRRAELKTAVALVMRELQPKFGEEFAGLVIPLYTQLLKVMPLSYDWSIVGRHAAEYPMETIEFLTEAAGSVEAARVAELLSELPPAPAMLQSLSGMKAKGADTFGAVCCYALRCLEEDTDCFGAAMDFWQRVFSRPGNEGLVAAVMRGAALAYGRLDEAAREESDGFFYGFLSVVAKNYPRAGIDYLRVNVLSLPIRAVSNFLTKVSKNNSNNTYDSNTIDSNSLLASLSLDSPYLNTLISFLTNNPDAPSKILSLDFHDKDSIKLVLSIMQKYNFSEAQIAAILALCPPHLLAAAELRVECLRRLGIPGDFSGEWSVPRVIEFYYFVKKDPSAYLRYKDSFYALFIQRAPFDRCFSIVQMLGNPPMPILQNIYDSLPVYPFIEISCLNNDLLAFLPVDTQRPFIERQAQRFVAEWSLIRDHKSYYQALKSLINLLNAHSNDPGFIDLLLELVQVDYSLTLNKIIAIFSAASASYNIRKAVYLFGSAYSNFNLADSQAQIAGALTVCLAAPDGPAAFSEILGLPLQKCSEVALQIPKINKKTGQNLVRSLLVSFKGKPLRKMFTSDAKVTKQNFLARNSPASASSDE